MNPLLLADWNRINRIISRLMWAIAVALVLVMLGLLRSHQSSEQPPSRAPASTPVGHVAPRAVQRS